MRFRNNPRIILTDLPEKSFMGKSLVYRRTSLVTDYYTCTSKASANQSASNNFKNFEQNSIFILAPGLPIAGSFILEGWVSSLIFDVVVSTVRRRMTLETLRPGPKIDFNAQPLF